jgi:hypothetical protein
LAEIDSCGIVQPDYSGCCESALPGVPLPPTQGPPGPTGPQGPEGPEGPEGPPGSEFNCPVYCGTGEPEGVQTSIVAGLYLQTDRAATSHPYFAKRTGTGNTGWRGWAGLRGSAAGSLEIGDNALATGIDSIAHGENTTASGLRSEAFGKSSIAAGIDSKAWGTGAKALHDFCIAIGLNSQAGSDDEFDDGDEDSTGCVAIGDGARAGIADADWNEVRNAIAIGNIASAIPRASIAIGWNAKAGFVTQDYDAIAIGTDSEAKSAFSFGDDGIVAIGPRARATDSGVSVGKDCNGNGASYEFTNAVTAIGTGIYVIGDCNVAAGFDTYISGNGCIAMGSHASSWGQGATSGNPIGGESDAVGSFASVSGANNSMAFGPRSSVSADANEAMAIGPIATAQQPGSIALGPNAVAASKYHMTIGGALASGNAGITGIHFNYGGGSTVGGVNPAILVNPDGTIEIVKDSAGYIAAPLVANYTLLTTDAGFYVNASGGNIIITLPTWNASSSNPRFWLRRMDSSANTITVRVAPASGDEFVDRTLLTYSSSFLLPAGRSLAAFARTGSVSGHPRRWRLTTDY